MTKIAIITPAYWKLDGSTAGHLRRTLESVAAQTYKNYKLFLVGDDYRHPEELDQLATILPPDKIEVYNLPVAVERTKYSGGQLWYCGGVNATLYGIQQAEEQGYEYICLLNHDDLFYPHHLQMIADCIRHTGAWFISTRCGDYPPVNTYGNLYGEFLPAPGKQYIVSVCANYKRIGLYPRNTVELGMPAANLPADADLWQRIAEWMEATGNRGVYIRQQTCEKVGGGDAKYKPEIVK